MANTSNIPRSEAGLLRDILREAIWAPSGDNSQPWIITVTGPSTFTLDLRTYERNTYQLLPFPFWLSNGMLLGNAEVAAHARGFQLRWEVRDEIVHASLHADPSTDHLAWLEPSLRQRSVNRFAYHRTPLDTATKTIAAAQMDSDMVVHWLEGRSLKWQVGQLLRQVTAMRLRVPELYAVHRDIIDWSGKDSDIGLPYKALGVSGPTALFMRVAMKSIERMRRLSGMPGSTLVIELELDLLASLRSGAHFVMAFDRTKVPNPDSTDYLRAGAALQRFLLALTAKGVALQPWYLPVLFGQYETNGIAFTDHAPSIRRAERMVSVMREKILGPRDLQADHAIFAGRVGYPLTVPSARSVRKPLEAFLA